MNKEGVGLGLAVSKNIARALNGDIFAESEIGLGSKFILTLPIQQNNEDSMIYKTDLSFSDTDLANVSMIEGNDE